MDRKQYKQYYNKKDIYFKRKIHWDKLNENKINPELIKEFPVNKPMMFNKNLMVKAIQYGMIILISYRGDKDKWRGGRERVICPMVLGRNKNTGNILIRGWHLDGWSVSEHKSVEKVWRLFKTSNIKSMTFTGNFFRLAPAGYKRNDRVMTETTYVAADFMVIRRNQTKLAEQGLIEDDTETNIGKEKGGISEIPSIEIKDTETILDLKDVWKNDYFNKKKQHELQVTIIKSTPASNDYKAVLGVAGPKGSLVKLYDGKKLIGTYMSVLSVPEEGNTLQFSTQINRHKQVDGKNEFPLFTFVKKK